VREGVRSLHGTPTGSPREITGRAGLQEPLVANRERRHERRTAVLLAQASTRRLESLREEAATRGA